MSKVKTIFKNASWLVLSQIFASICGFIWTILIARYLGVDQYGIIGFAISFTGIISITMDFGISTHIVRQVSTENSLASKYLGNAVPLKSIFAISTFIFALAVLIIMKCNELTITITLLFTIEMIIKSILGVIGGTFMAFEEGKYQGITNTITNALLLIFILIAIFTDLGIYGITLSYILANLIALFYAYISLKKHIVRPKFELDIKFCKKIFKASIPFAIIGFLYTVYYSIDVVMLTMMSGEYATGIYNATYKLISILTIFYSIYSAVIFPVMSKFYKNNEELLLVSFEKSIKYLTMIIVPLALAMSFYSTDIIHLIYGSEYYPAASVLQILIWTVCFLLVDGVFTTLLSASHKEIAVTKIYVGVAAFNIILNLILIPKYSYNGAALATVLSDIFILIMCSYTLYKIGHKPNEKLYYDIVKIIVGTTILGISLHFLNLNMWIALPVGIIIYFTAIYLLGVFDDDDKYVIREIIGKN